MFCKYTHPNFGKVSRGPMDLQNRRGGHFCALSPKSMLLTDCYDLHPPSLYRRLCIAQAYSRRVLGHSGKLRSVCIQRVQVALVYHNTRDARDARVDASKKTIPKTDIINAHRCGIDSDYLEQIVNSGFLQTLNQ